MSLKSTIIGIATNRAAARFDAAAKDPAGAQQRKLMELIERNANTEYGKKYGFSSIKTHADYVKAVPLITYEDIKHDMDRVTEGAKNVFTVEDAVMFAQTSGTTGDAKFIPVTPTCRGRAHSDVMRTWMSHARRAHPGIFSGQMLTLVSPAVEGHTAKGVPYGSTSGFMYREQSNFVRSMYAVPYEAFEIEDYNARYYAIMRFTMDDDVRFVATANPSSILKLCEKGDEYAEQIIKDIRDGTLSKDFEIEPGVRKALEPMLKAMPARAKMLEQCRSKRDGRMLPGDYWSNIALIGCWKGGTVGHYLEKYPGWFDPDGTHPIPVRDWGYLSSEARGSVPISDQGSQGVLTIDSNYFEFSPVDEVMAKPDDPTSWTYLPASEIQEGEEYYIFVSTTGGLYRYDINDVIKVTGRYHKAPQIVFLRKGRGMTNITGEKVSVNQIIETVERASKASGLVAGHFKAEADGERGRYIFRVEFVGRPNAEEVKAFLQTADTELKDINIEYKSKRESQRLNAPVLHMMREGWYERQRKAQVEAGKRMFQAKTELLSPVRAQTMQVKPDLLDVVELS